MEHLFVAAGWDLAEPLPDGWSVDMASLGALGEQSGQHVLGPPLDDDELIADSLMA